MLKRENNLWEHYLWCADTDYNNLGFSRYVALLYCTSAYYSGVRYDS